MPYTLSDLLKELMSSLGQTETFLATGGTTATIINTKIGERPKTYQDDYAIDGYALISLDAGLAGAAPEKEYRRISGYDSSTYKYTVDTVFSASPAVGDEVVIISPLMNLRSVITCVNRALYGLFITLPDVSLVTVAQQQTYTLPVTAKLERPRKVEIQTIAGDNDSYQERTDYRYVYSAPGSTASLVFGEDISTGGLTIRIQNDVSQPYLTNGSAVLSETITPRRALATCEVAVLAWWNNQNGGQDDYWLRRENMARDELKEIKMEEKISKPKRSQSTFVAPI